MRYPLDWHALDMANMGVTHSIHKATRTETRDLPVDILVLILSMLHGQDIAICARVSVSTVPYRASGIHSSPIMVIRSPTTSQTLSAPTFTCNT